MRFIVYHKITMENLRIFLLNGAALTLSSVSIINPYLQTASLCLAIIYTVINIYKRLSNGKD